MPEPKRISADAVPAALEKALRYRLLNEPLEAESICRDILAVQPDNQQAMMTLLLALTDQFDKSFATAMDQAKALLPRLAGEYEQAYYEGIIKERWAKSQLTQGVPVSVASAWFQQAMRCYERAERFKRPDDPDAVLRWNTCARFLAKQPADEQQAAGIRRDVVGDYGDDVPPR